MSGLSYFQRYSQKENHATNNTLLLFKYFYQKSPKRFSDFLESLAEDDSFNVGVQFEQQIKGHYSIPDGLISQDPFHIYIETKLGSDLDTNQITSHFKTIKDKHPYGEQIYLMGLTKAPLFHDRMKEIKKIAAEHKVKFFSTTYTSIIDAASSLVQEFETDLIEIIDDYNDYLLNEKLKTVDENLLLTVLTGQSLEENIEHNFYYEPAERPAKWHAKYIGLYADKKVSYIGEIRCAVRCVSENGKLKLIDNEAEYGIATEQDLERIHALLHDENSVYFPELRDNAHRYYFVHDFNPTYFTKTSKGGMMGHRYFDLRKLLIKNTKNAGKVAEGLKNKSFD